MGRHRIEIEFDAVMVLDAQNFFHEAIILAHRRGVSPRITNAEVSMTPVIAETT